MLPIIHYLCTSAYELSNLSRSSKVKKKTILQQKNKIFGLILASKVPLDAIKTFLLKQTAATAIIFRPLGEGSVWHHAEEHANKAASHQQGSAWPPLARTSAGL